MRRIGLLLVLLWSVLGVISVSAQAAPPIFAIANGHLLRQEGAEMQGYTACQPPDEGLLSTLIMSPNNRYLLMETQPTFVRDVIVAQGGIGGGALPSNLWMCDTEANVLAKIGSQPANASFMQGDVPNVITIRSAPAWSPDGAQVAWIEQTFPKGDFDYSLMIFTIAQNTIIQVPLMGLPAPVGESAPYPMMWGDAGIMLIVFALDETTFVTTETLYLFDKNGQYLRYASVGAAGETDDFINDRILVRYKEKEYMGLLYDRAGWVLMDVSTGEKQPMPGVPELYSRTAPSGITLDVSLDDDQGYIWHIQDSDQTLDGISRQRLSLSPDGSRVAYGTDEVRIWAAGQQVTLEGSGDFADDPSASLAWSAMGWRVREDPDVIATLTAQPTVGVQAQTVQTIIVTATSATVQLVPTVTPNTCAGLLTPRLQAGTQGRVTAGGVPNNVRENPLIGATKVGQIAPSGTFDVLEGPVCADGYVWYRVRVGTVEGWTAEGGNGAYWIEPVQ